MFVLVRWTGEETLSVVADTSVRSSQNIYVGVFAEFKWAGKYYEGEVLALSESKQLLLKKLNMITDGELTREELLESHTTTVHSTTPEKTTASVVPGKTPKNTTASVVTGKVPKSTKAKRMSAAKDRARDLFDHPRYKTPENPEKISDDQASLIQSLQKQLRELQEAVSISKATPKTSVRISASDVINSKIDAQAIVVTHRSSSGRSSISSGEELIEDAYVPEFEDHIIYGEDKVLTPAKPKVPTENAALREITRDPPQQVGNGEDKVLTPAKPKVPTGNAALREITRDPPQQVGNVKKVELVEGYGVYLTQRQLDEAIDQSCNTATRLARNLLSCFFPPSVLANSSCYGTRRYPQLNEDVIGACFRFVQSRHPSVSRSTLVNAINDKCANYRRVKVKKEK